MTSVGEHSQSEDREFPTQPRFNIAAEPVWYISYCLYVVRHITSKAVFGTYKQDKDDQNDGKAEDICNKEGSFPWD